jgi:hypothetical protein
MDFLLEPGEHAFGEIEPIAGSGEFVGMPGLALQETPRIFTGQSGALL